MTLVMIYDQFIKFFWFDRWLPLGYHICQDDHTLRKNVQFGLQKRAFWLVPGINMYGQWSAGKSSKNKFQFPSPILWLFHVYYQSMAQTMDNK